MTEIKDCPACNKPPGRYCNTVDDDRQPIHCYNPKCPLFDVAFYEPEWNRIGECCNIVSKLNTVSLRGDQNE